MCSMKLGKCMLWFSKLLYCEGGNQNFDYITTFSFSFTWGDGGIKGFFLSILVGIKLWWILLMTHQYHQGVVMLSQDNMKIIFEHVPIFWQYIGI